MIIALLLLAQTKSVTFSHPCASSAVVLEALGKQLGVQMKPSGSVMKDFIIVRFDQVPVEEAMKRLADGINATWTQSNGVNYLTRTPAQEAKERQEADTVAIKMIQDWLDKRKVEGLVTLENSRALLEEVLPLLKNTAGSNFDQQSYERQRALDVKSPIARYLTRILKEIGASSLVDVKEGERAQYVERPIGKQRQLPSGEAQRLFTVENEIYKEAVMRSGAIERLNQEGSTYSSLVHPYSSNYRHITQTMLTVRRQRDYFSVQLQVAGFGEVYEAITPNRQQPQGMPEALLKQEGNYEPTEIETELGRAANVLFSGRGGTTTISAEAVTALSDPVTYEPLSVFGSKWLLDATKALGRNLVGVVEDEGTVAAMFMASQGQTGFAQFWQSLPRMGSGYKVSLDDKWLTIYPSDPIVARQGRLDRDDWKRAIARGAPGKPATLEDYAAFAALSDREDGVMVAMLPAAFMGHGISMDQMGRTGNMDAFRIYGRITSLQQKASREGGTEMLLSRMAAPLSGPVSRLVNQQNARIENKRRVLGWDQPNMVYVSRTEHDPMQLLPRGYPPASVMRVYVLKRDVVHQKRDTGYGGGEGQLPESIGQVLASMEASPGSYSHMHPFFAVAPAEQLLIELEFTNVGFMYHRMQVDFLPKDAVFKPLKDLPAGVRADIEAALKKYREQYKKARGGGG